MKKLPALIAALALIAVMFTGCGLAPSCGGETAKSEDMSKKPWSNLYNYEKTSYKVNRYAAINGEDGSFSADTDKILAEGSYVSEITTVDVNISEWDGLDALGSIPGFEEVRNSLGELSSSPSAYSVLKTSFDLTYTNAAENGSYAGAADTMETVVLFRNINFMPVFSYKTAELGSSGISYSAFADYLSGKNTYSQSGSDETGNVTERVTEITQNLDNDMMFLLERAQTGLQSGLGTSFSLHSPVETGVYGKEAVNTISVNVTSDVADNAADNYAIDPEDISFADEYVGDAVKFYDETEAEEAGTSAGLSFPVNRVVFYRNDTNMGTSTTAYYSDIDFDYYGITTSNVMMYFATYEMDPFEETATSMTIASISDYTIVPEISGN